MPALVGMGLAIALALAGCRNGSIGAPEGGEGSEATSSPTDPSTAFVFRDREAACTSFSERADRAQVTEEIANQDRSALGIYLEQQGVRVQYVSLSTCDSHLVIYVGVSDWATRLPAAGARGTPVLAYVQPPFYAG